MCPVASLRRALRPHSERDRSLGRSSLVSAKVLEFFEAVRRLRTRPGRSSPTAKERLKFPALHFVIEAAAALESRGPLSPDAKPLAS
jgi:hypothetical protein